MKISITESNKNRILGIVLWITLWEVAYLIIDQAIYLPSPFHVIQSFMNLIIAPDFYKVIILSSWRVLISFIIAAFFGIVAGFFCGINKKAYEIFEPFVILLRSTPVIAVIILAIVWLPSNYVPIFSGFLMCFPIIFTNMHEGIEMTDVKLIEMSKIYQITNYSIFKDIYLPSSMPYIKAGLSTALGLSWKVIAAAEVLSLPKYAIGSHLYDSKVYLEIADLFAWTLVIIILSYIFNHLLAKLFYRNNSLKR